jgi:hypothetical protein
MALELQRTSLGVHYSKFCKCFINLLSFLLSETPKITIYRMLTLRLVLYWYKTWFLAVIEEQKLKVFDNTRKNRLFGRRDEASQQFGMLYKRATFYLYRSTSEM